jgi:hypothetical protein
VNKKILGIAVALLAVAVLATPLLGTVEACGCGGRWRRPKIIPVTASTVPTGSDPFDTWDWWITENGRWVIGRNIGVTGAGSITIGSETYTVTSAHTYNLIVNINTNKGVIFFPSMEWTLLNDDDVVVGTFEGAICGKIVVYSYFGEAYGPIAGFPNTVDSDFELYGVLKGTGMFTGQTLILKGTKAAGLNPFEWTGFLLTR